MSDRGSGGSSRPPPSGPDPLIDRLIDQRYRIKSLIARGGMGKVYRAEQEPLGRPCAVKILFLTQTVESDEEFQKRFFLEASIAAKLTHPNTVTIFDYGRTEDDIYYMAMELLEGVTLHRAIREARGMPEERVAHIGRQICRALREAHALGVIHRDLKPANVFLVRHGDEVDFVKVLDFGLVKHVGPEKQSEDLTQAGLFMGSPKYMAPEQIRGERVDARTDVYSLGILLYEMLTGKVPFERSNSVNILMAHVNEEVPPLTKTNPNVHVSRDMEDTVMRCLSKNPASRYASMDEVLQALKRVTGGAATATISALLGDGIPESRPLPGLASHPSMTPSEPSGPPVHDRSSLPPEITVTHASVTGISTRVSLAPKLFKSVTGPPPSGSAYGRFALFVLVAFGIAGGVYGYFAAEAESDRAVDAGAPADARADVGVRRDDAAPRPTSSVLPSSLGALGATGDAATDAFATSLDASSDATVPGDPVDAATAFLAADGSFTWVSPDGAVVAVPESDTRVPTVGASVARLRIETEPPGARVREDGTELCVGTPCTIVWSGVGGEKGATHKLSFARAGYRSETRTMTIGKAFGTVRLTRAPGAGNSPRDPDPVPSGYKPF